MYLYPLTQHRDESGLRLYREAKLSEQKEQAATEIYKLQQREHMMDETVCEFV